VDIGRLVAAVDEEISRLQQVRNLLRGGGGGVPSPFAERVTGRKKRVLSAKARKAISDAQKRRWAAQKKAEK
jgi:hypothetical protein